MASDLKPYFEDANKAEAEVQRIMAEMKSALELGTAEGNQQALALKPALVAAQTIAKTKMQLYLTLRDRDFKTPGIRPKH